MSYNLLSSQNLSVVVLRDGLVGAKLKKVTFMLRRIPAPLAIGPE